MKQVCIQIYTLAMLHKPLNFLIHIGHFTKVFPKIKVNYIYYSTYRLISLLRHFHENSIRTVFSVRFPLLEHLILNITL